jgi:hypothetical protein
MHDDGLDIPDYLRLSREDRIAAWQLFDEMPKAATVKLAEDNGPGSVARRLGFPENPADTIAREALADKERERAAIKQYENDRARYAFFERKQAEKAETDKVKAEAAAKHKQAVKAFSGKRRRKSF